MNNFPKVFVKCVRYTGDVESLLWLAIPTDVYNSGDPTAVHQYIGEQLDWCWFMHPKGMMVACYTPEHVESLLSETP